MYADSRCIAVANRAVVVLRILLALLFVGLLVGQTLSMPGPAGLHGVPVPGLRPTALATAWAVLEPAARWCC